MYQVKHISPSQIKTWRTCQRKWWYEKVAGIRQESTPAQRLGTDVHELLEHYVAYGKVLPDNFAGQIAKAALPIVNEEAKCEHQFTIPLVDGIVGTGRIDFTHFGVIEDLKTTSSMRYAKTPEELKTDPQAIMYLWAAQNDGALAFFTPINRFSHLIVETKAPHPIKRVDCELTDAEIAEGMEGIKKDALEMREAAKSKVETTRYNLDACRMYGGCHLRETCARSGLFYTPTKKDGETMGILDSLRDKKKANLVQKGPPAPEPEPMPEVAEPSRINPPDGVGETVALDPPTMKKGRSKSEVPAWCPNHAGVSTTSLKKAQAIEVWEALKAIVYNHPTDIDLKSMYSLLDWSPDGKMATEVKTQVRSLIEALPKGFTPKVAVASEPVASEPVASEPVASEPVASEPVASEPVASATVKKGWLFIGCRPEFHISDSIHLDELLTPIRKAVQNADPDKRHWLLISDYGVNGSCRVAATLEQLIRNGAEIPPVILADEKLPGHAEAITVLRATHNPVKGI